MYVVPLWETTVTEPVLGAVIFAVPMKLDPTPSDLSPEVVSVELSL